jgi:hypothetical protein
MFKYYRWKIAILLLLSLQGFDVSATIPPGTSKPPLSLELRRKGPHKKQLTVLKIIIVAGSAVVAAMVPIGLYSLCNRPDSKAQASNLPAARPKIRCDMDRWVYSQALPPEDKAAFQEATGLNWDGLFNKAAPGRYSKATITYGTRRCAEMREALNFCQQYKSELDKIRAQEKDSNNYLKIKACYELWSKLARECVIGHINDYTLVHTKIPPLKALRAVVNSIHGPLYKIREGMDQEVRAVLLEIIAKARPGATPTIEVDFPPLQKKLDALLERTSFNLV